MAIPNEKLTAKAARMRELVGQFERSGETVAQFAHRQGMTTDTFRWWRRRFASQEVGPKIELVELGAPNPERGFELRLANGMTVKVAAQFDAVALERLLGVVSRC